MIRLVANKKTTKVTVYAEKANKMVKIRTNKVIAYDDVYTEPKIFIDGGLYNQDAELVSAGFYNTTSWNETWNAGNV